LGRKPTDQVALTLRIRESLRRRLEREALRHDQSLNAELTNRLEESFRRADADSILDLSHEERGKQFLKAVSRAALHCPKWERANSEDNLILQLTTLLLVRACASGEVPREWPPEIVVKNVQHELKADAIALAILVFEPREAIVKSLEEDAQ
jgi:hypothetical protein